MTNKIGIIDLGTNTFHLLLAEVKAGKTRITYRERQAVKIGMGGINQGVITEEAIVRALQCLHRFKTKLKEENVAVVRALGTSALRTASNGADLIQKIQEETGIAVEVISGEQEAEYIYYGIRSAMNLGTAKSLIVDIGGGSVEFIICDREKIFWKRSIDIGAQRMLELYHKHDPILPEELVQLQAHYHQVLTPLLNALGEFQPDTLVGSSGTFDTFSEVYCRKHELQFAASNSETPLTLDDCMEIHHDLIAKDRRGRMMIPGMIEMRVDMIVVASCLINYLVGQFTFQKIRVSSYSLKEGVLASLTKK